VSLTVRVVDHGSEDYEACVELRREILRRPLGLDFSLEQLQGEDTDTHVAAFDGEELVGCLVLTPQEQDLKMRQVAVAVNRQGTGVGRNLVKASEEIAAEQGFARITLHARDTAIPFYERLGYQVEGEPFVEVGIPHRAMSKSIGR
jgi:predicted GNAT family N-acyltransferase